MAVLKVKVNGKIVEGNDVDIKAYLASDAKRRSCKFSARVRNGEVNLVGLDNNELYLFVANKPISTESTVIARISEIKELKFGPLWVGDYNGDGSVDDFDFITFKTHYQNNDLQSDFNGDNRTDDFDFIIFKTSYVAKAYIKPLENDENIYNIIDSGDQWYKVSFNQAGRANFYVQPEGSNLDVDLYIYDSNKTTLLEKSIKRGVQYDLVSEMQVQQNKTYYIRIKHSGGSGIYQLRTKCYMQLNNDENVANTIDNGDHWYATVFNEFGKANFFVDPSDNLDVDLYVYDSEQIELGNSKEGTGKNDLVEGINVEPGKKYYVKVKHCRGTGTYNIRCKNYLKTNKYMRPVDNADGPLTSLYGWRTLWGKDNWHSGLDIGVPIGTPIKAMADARMTIRVDSSNYNYQIGYGCYVILYFDNITVIYGHCSPDKLPQEIINRFRKVSGVPYINTTQPYKSLNAWCRASYSNSIKVKKGEIVAFSGDTGLGGPHLHFNLQIADAPDRNTTIAGFSEMNSVDPMTRLNFFDYNIAQGEVSTNYAKRKSNIIAGYNKYRMD